jgi:PadR family transcriptional regulator PadR
LLYDEAFSTPRALPEAREIMIFQTLRTKPMRGYAIVQNIKNLPDDLLQIEEGSLYPASQRMLRQVGWNPTWAFLPGTGRHESSN